MLCPKCKIEMYRDDDLNNLIMVHACVICGRRVYDGYPSRKGERAQRRWEAQELKNVKLFALKMDKKGMLSEVGKQQKPMTEAEEELLRVKRELAEVKMERDLLKKAAAYFAKESQKGTRS